MAAATASYTPHMSNQDDDNLQFFFDDSISPTSALFPPELCAPSTQFFTPSPYSQVQLQEQEQEQQQQQQQRLHRPSLGNLNDSLIQSLQPYLSRPPSLSPSPQSAQLVPPLHSPHSSASPTSNFSFSASEDVLFSNSFSPAELDALLFQSDMNQPGKQGNPFYIPQTLWNSNPQQMSLAPGDSFDISSFSDMSPTNDQSSFSVSSEQYPTGQSIPTINTPALPQQVSPDQWMPQSISTQHINNQWQNAQHGSADSNNASPSQAQNGFNNAAQRAEAKPQVAPPKPTVSSARRPVKSESLTDAPPPGKHNKTERRYRQNVQAAQAALRDSVPALRVLYGTSTDEQQRSTDLRASDGTVDGLGVINRPNASAKTTIFLGARMYIELLQSRVGTLQRKVDDLEAFRAAVAGEDNLSRWQEEFDSREAERRALEPVRSDDDSLDEEDDESEDEGPKRKKPRASNVKAKKNGDTIRALAAFAISFSFLPSASTLYDGSASMDLSSHHYASATRGQVLARLPLITAEHTSRLLARGLPASAVPHPHTLVDWIFRLILTIVVVAILRPLYRKLARQSEDDDGPDIPVGQLTQVATDAFKVALRVQTPASSETAAWVTLASQVVGGVRSASVFQRWHIVLRLRQSGQDAFSMALQALIQSDFPVGWNRARVWKAAGEKLETDSPVALRTALGLPFDDALRALQLLPPTASPITAIAEQVTLVHLNDLYSGFFVRLVDASTTGGHEIPNSVKALLANLESRDMGNTLRASSFDQEIKTVIADVSKGTAAHALGLVLIGLWGLLTGPTASAQAALASALAAEEVKGVGASLASVSALRELLYPGSRIHDIPDLVALPRNAIAIDKLALVCIQYIRLLASTTAVDQSRLERLESSLLVQKAVSNIRLVLSQANFLGLDEDEVEGDSTVFDEAREKMVSVLSVIGRRAAGRASGRDEDSGLEGDLDEL